MNVRDCMMIYWPTPSGHEEVSGICFYGYFRAGAPTVQGSILPSTWTDFTSSTNQRRIVIDSPDFDGGVPGDSVVILEVRIQHWPGDERWAGLVSDTLDALIRAEASVAWCGDESCSWSPSILNPESMSGDVYAGYAAATGFLCNSTSLLGECAYLDDSSLERLHMALVNHS